MTANILVVDIERQSGLADGVWQGKQFSTWIAPDRLIEPPRTICFAYRWLHEDKTKFVAEWDNGLPQDNTSHTPGGGHKLMLEKARDLFDQADYVVGWNSKNFDVKYLRTGWWLYDITPPSPHVDIDLMLQHKRNFETYAKSLAYVAKTKGMEGKIQNEHGLWRKLRFSQGDILRRAQRSMKKYNIRDVDQTLEIFNDVRPWLNNLNLGLYVDDNEIRCSNCGSDDIHYRGTQKNRTHEYKRFQCQGCGKWGRDTKSFKSINTTGIG